MQKKESVAKLPLPSLRIEKIPDQNLTCHYKIKFFKKFSKPYKKTVMVKISKLKDVWE
jgi:hypothetical protein